MDEIDNMIEPVYKSFDRVDFYIVWDKVHDSGYHFKNIENARIFAILLIILKGLEGKKWKK